MIQNTCKLRTNNFSCDCCDEHNCQRYIAYQLGRTDAINEFRELIIARIQSKNRGLYVIEAMDIAEQLKEQNND